MAKTWVLDTETKGTGAHMVPLEQTLRRGSEERKLDTVRLGPAPAPAPAPEAAQPAPLRFRVVDVLSSSELAHDVDARAAIEELTRLRSVLDARIYVWVPQEDRWRLLTLDERRLMWRFRDELARSAPAAAGTAPA
jgi:hypothetical protein